MNDSTQKYAGPHKSAGTRICAAEWLRLASIAGWWFGTFFIFPNSWDDDPI
jgi:hypothetical protein